MSEKKSDVVMSQGVDVSEEELMSKINRTSSKLKKVLYLEEFMSAFLACAFGLNVACFMFNPIGLSIINILLAIWFLSHFKTTVLRQEKYHLHLKLLENFKENKVWIECD